MADRAVQQLRGDLRRPVRQRPPRPGEPVRHPLVHHPVAVRLRQGEEQLPGDLLRRRARVGQRPGGLPVQREPQRGGRAVVQDLADQRVPEAQPHAGLGQHAGPDGLLDRRGELAGRPPGEQGELGDGEVGAHQARRAQHPERRPGQEVQPVGDRRDQRERHAAVGVGAGELHRAGLGPHPPLPDERVDHLPDVQGVPGRPGDRPAQGRTDTVRAEQAADQLGHRSVRERAQLDELGAGGEHAVPEPDQLGPARHRPARGDEQQRELRGHPGEPLPDQQARLVRPVQVVDDEHHGLRAQLVDQGEQPLGHGGHQVGGAGTDRAVAEAGEDPPPRGVLGRGADLQAVEQHPQREPPVQLGGGTAEHPAAERFRRGEPGVEQCGLADPRLALHPRRPAVAGGDRPDQRAQPAQLGVPPDNCADAHTSRLRTRPALAGAALALVHRRDPGDRDGAAVARPGRPAAPAAPAAARPTGRGRRGRRARCGR